MSTITVFLNHLLTLTDEFSVNPGHNISHTLTNVNTFSFDIIHNIIQIQTLIELYPLTVSTSRSLTDTPTLRNQFTGYTNNPNTIQNPIPSMPNPGENSQPDPVDLGPGLGPFTAGALRYVTETVSFSCAGANLVIKAPDFGDKHTIQPHYYTKDTDNFALIQFRDVALWRDFTTFELSFSQLDEDEVASIRFFLRASCGKGIVYTDLYGNNHTGVIPDPDQQATSSTNGYSIKFSFLEGALA